MTDKNLQISDLGDLGTGIRMRPMEAVDRAMDNLVSCVKALVREAKWSTDLGKETRKMLASFIEGDPNEEAVAKIKDMAIFHCLHHLSTKHWQVWFGKTCIEIDLPNWSALYGEDIRKGIKELTQSRIHEINRALLDFVCGESNVLAATRFFVVDIIHSPDIDWKITERVRILKSIAEDYKLPPPTSVASEPLYGELLGYHLLDPGVYISGNKQVSVDEEGNIKSNEAIGDINIFSYSGPPVPIGKITK